MDSSNIVTYDWVQLVDPKTQKLMYINLKSGECSRDPPKNVKYKTVSPNQWWELFDIKAQRNYYYNSNSRETVWQKPVDGDIIPLAKIQLLQQHLQPSLTFQKDLRKRINENFNRTLDIGILRRSDNNNHMNIDYQEDRLSTSLTQRNCANVSVATEIPDYLFDNMFTQQDDNLNNNSSDKLSHYPMLVSTNSNRNHSVTINESVNSVHSPLSLYTKTEKIDIPNLTTINASNDNQCVRDWLCNAVANANNEVKSNISYCNTITTTANTSNNSSNTNGLIIDRSNSNIKKPGCLSDRPVRRHNIQSSQLQGLIEFPIQLADKTSNPQFRSISQSVNQNHDNNSINFVSIHGNTSEILSSCNTNNYPVQYAQNVPFKFLDNNNNNNIPTVSSESTVSVQKGSGIINSNESVVDVQQIISFAGDKPFEASESHLCGIVKQSSMPPTFSYGIPQPTPRQRAFPRTNPTVSRPSATCTIPRACTIQSDGSVNSLFPTSVAFGQFSDSCSTRTSITDSKVSIIHGLNSKDSSALIKSKLPGPISSDLTFRDFSNPDNLSEYDVTSSHASNTPLKFSCSVSSITPSSSYSLNKSNIMNSAVGYLPIDSPLSASPQTSTSPPLSPTSFSSASSATALTTANSDESIDITNDVVLNSESWNILPSDPKSDSNLNKIHKPAAPCFPNATIDYSDYVTTLGENVNEEEDHLRPPTPPPRSASTLCSQGMSNVFFVSFPNHIPQNSLTPSFDQPAGYLQTHYPYYSHACPNPSTAPSINISLTSSLSRNHPSRAHVIQPNSRRAHRTQYYTQQIQNELNPLSYDKEIRFNENNVDTTCFISPTDLCSSQHPKFIVTSQPNTQLRSTVVTVLPSAGVCTAITGSNVWNTKSINLWDGNNCFNTSANESVQTVESYGNKPSTTTAVSSTTTKAYSTANLMSNLPRSASGGFIGPGDSTDLPMWTCGPFTNSINSNSHSHSTAPFRKIPQQIYVHPGHPAFSTFIGPYDWPSHLFKADQDISSLMSWTKSNFSKRLLVFSEPGLKKQVAQLFKVIQSFMGDRKARLSLPDYGSIIIHRALSSANLRDELYAQLCKQTTSNPDVKSLTHGWALLCVCLYYFPPNSKFRDHLYAYLQSRANASVISNTTSNSTININSGVGNNIDEFNNNTVPTESSLRAAAAIASGLNMFTLQNTNTNGISLSDKYLQQPNDLSINSRNFSQHSGHNYSMGIALGPWDRPTAAHFARVAPRWFVRSLNVGVRRTSVSPSIEEICHVKDFLLKPCIFGSSLDEMMQIQAYRFPHLRLPWIQIFLTEEILRLNGAQAEGIFRLSPDMDALIEVRCQLEKLFEIFRVVQLCDSELQNDNHTNDYDLSSSRFLVHRPPPAGWSTSSRVIEAEDNQNSCDTDSSKTSRQNSLLSPTLDWNCLTGEFSWPLLPEPLSLPPAEYILLTPTAYWPRTLSSIIKRCCSMSSSLSLTSMANNSSNSANMESHLAAGLLKLWLRELSQPLIPVELQPLCLKAACEAEAYELQDKDSVTTGTLSSDLNPLQKCCRLVRCLNPLPRRSLLYLILLLQHLSKPEHSNVSLMDARNLSTVIAPNLMRSSTSQDPRELLQNVRPQTLFIRLLITYLDIGAELKYLKEEENNVGVDEDLEGGLYGKLSAEVVDTDGNDNEIRLTQMYENNNSLASCNNQDKLSLESNGYVYLSSPLRVKLGPDNGFVPI